MKEKDINSLEHTSWRCQYHIVFAPKYRRLAIYREIKVDIGKKDIKTVMPTRRNRNNRSRIVSRPYPYVDKHTA